MTDISRDPRWGRVSEGNGEDPFLGAAIAKAMIKGYQGDDLALENTILSCVKHFALYGASEAGRDYNTVDMSRLRMYNEYFPPYKAAVEAGVASVMTSFNEVDGIPASGNRWLMTEVLRNQWGFNGFVVTDYTAILEMTDHGLGDLQQVSTLALKAGVDMDMVSAGFLNTLQKSLQEGKITEKDIDAACRRILKAKFQLGLFDDPYRYCNPDRAARDVFTPAHRDVARKAASQTFVLLKNDKQTLPLAPNRKIALVGPLANNRENMTGTWSVAANFEQSASVLEGLQASMGSDARIIYARGANVADTPELEEKVSIFGKPTYRDNRPQEVLIREAVQAANQSDVVVAVLGEAAEMSGEASSRVEIGLPENQKNLLKALLATGKPVVLVLFTGRPLTLTWENEHVPAILNVWFPGSEAGHAVADVLLGKVNPSGKLSTTFPQHAGQIPLYYNHKNTGRPLNEGGWFQKFRSNYLDVSNDPLYPFGFGLSYTTFSYGPLQLSSENLKGETALTVSVKVTNTGHYDGAEVVQLYIRDLVGSITLPVKSLKGFEKVFLKAGETKEIQFAVTTEHLKFYNYNLEYDWEPGEFEIMVGGNSRDVQTVKINWER
jgi:beta-glucosidase